MKVKITETALRDAHQSLLATRMRTRHMLPIAEEMDKVGYHAVEAWGGATFDTCIRFLNEDPWERLRELKKCFIKTPIQMLLRGQNLLGYKHYPDDIVTKFVEKSYENGVDIFRIFDALNDVRNMEKAIKVAKAQGAHVQGTISYTISPVHTVDKYVELAKELESLDCDSVAIKDMAGLITPQSAYELILRLKEETGLLVELHSHCTSGITPISYYAACEAGVDILDTAISPFAWGTSQPPTESIVAALEGTEFDTGLSLKQLNVIKKYFEQIRKEEYEGLINPISERIDTDVLTYQLPGGMLSNLVSQLEMQNALDRYEDVLLEMPKVRKDMGYPPLVTPTSQIVGTQAVINVLEGERYKRVTNEVKDYMRGYYGRSPAPINQELAKEIIGDEEIIECRPADLLEDEFEKYKKEGEEQGLIKCDEDVLTLALFPQPAVGPKFLKGEAVEEEIPSVNKVSSDMATSYTFEGIPNKYTVEVNGEEYNVTIYPEGMAEPREEYPEYTMLSNLDGNVFKINVKEGDEVKKGDLIAIFEVMKMENNVLSEYDGIVKELHIKEGDAVKKGDPLVWIE
ncbi:MAG: sodium-extruding oxaloacetate decarboxylase subunit alpha [Methanobacteriaceae archaeon]|nr:sodium-extruding oxaloacetate decarboxylase subunit alpha [Methanobacteriaceae archaeon]